MVFNTANQVLETFKTALKSIYPQEEIRNFVLMLLEYKIGFSKIDFLMKGSEELSSQTIQFCQEALEQLMQHIPIQYIIGETEFYGLPFKVSPAVLIPRPETEELVQWIIHDNKLACPNILDIGSGSGCIPISLKKHIPDAMVSSWDISEEALRIAKANALLNKTEVNFIKNDALNPVYNPEQFDIIVSNPPYVMDQEKKLMQDNVIKHEPHLALFVSDNDPLIFYRNICKLAAKALKPGGTLYFEINEALGKETELLMKEYGFEQTEVRKDLFGKDRMAKGVKH
ncbi:peptide chain release factor N(5)-glutamine methyltransferase [Labilibacter sediminis]|nr:peptide chain release factor N(5)-glutamine methyltransferase [Labilibacter sediminis]